MSFEITCSSLHRRRRQIRIDNLPDSGRGDATKLERLSDYNSSGETQFIVECYLSVSLIEVTALIPYGHTRSSAHTSGITMSERGDVVATCMVAEVGKDK